MKVTVLTNGFGKDRELIANGMDLYRLYMPYCKIDGAQIASKHDVLNSPLDSDVYVINRAHPIELFTKLKEAGKKIILDIDDYWKIPTWHQLHHKSIKGRIEHATSLKNDEAVRYFTHQLNEVSEWEKQTQEVVKIVDAVTCSTETLARHIKNEYGIDATVVPNTIDPNITKFSTNKQPSRFTRFGFIAGMYRERDAALMFNGVRSAYQNKHIRSKVQFVNSFNLHPSFTEVERMFTFNYTQLPDFYRDYLKSFVREGNHIGNQQFYKRLWAKDAIDYGVMYEEVDVALIPMEHGVFNSCKSELKLIEAGWTKCAAIVSNVLPYAPHLQHNVNALVCNEKEGWFTAILRLTNDKELRERLANNLHDYVREHFNQNIAHEKVTQVLNTL